MKYDSEPQKISSVSSSAATVMTDLRLMLEYACEGCFSFVLLMGPPYAAAAAASSCRSMDAMYQSTAERLSSGTKNRISAPL